MRSGATWQFNLVATLVEQQGAGERNGSLDQDIANFPYERVAEWVEDTGTYHVVKAGADANTIATLHDALYQEVPRARICYIYRDFRDVAASTNRDNWLDEGNWDALIEELDITLENDKRIRQLPNVLIQRYEDAVGDPASAVQEIADFLQLTPSEQDIKAVVRECSVESMLSISGSRSMLYTKKLRETLTRMWRTLPAPFRKRVVVRRLVHLIFPKYEARTLVGARHISSTRGAPGAWRVRLDQEQQTFITARYEKWLVANGYDD
jgi:hypothetical protein